MPPARRDLGERGQCETPRRQFRVGKHRIRRGAHQATEVQNVDVDFSRSVAKSPASSDASLDPLKGFQQSLWSAAASDLGGHVPEEGLVRVADRFRLVNRRRPEPHTEFLEGVERCREAGTAVAEVRTQSQEDPASGGRRARTLPLPLFRPLPRRPTRLRRRRVPALLLQFPRRSPRTPGFHRGSAP
jgi:hypothetical protein